MAEPATTPDRQQRAAEAARLVAAGATERAAAERLGVSRATVRRDLAAVRTAPVALPAPRPRPRAAFGSGRRARLSGDKGGIGSGFANAAAAILRPPDKQGDWRLQRLDRDTLGKATTGQLIEYLAELSPELSRAKHDFLRLCNPGWAFRALVPGTDGTHDAGEAALGEMVAAIARHHGSFRVPLNRLFSGLLMRGGCFAELVLARDGRTVVDLATPDPFSVRFRKQDDADRGEFWQLGQQNGRGEFVALDAETVGYVPYDPPPGSPYGRAPLASGLFPCLFILQLHHDLRRVVAQQGYPRPHITIDQPMISALYEEMVADARSRGEEEPGRKDLVDEAIAEVAAAWAELEPDDAYVSTTMIGVNRPLGTLDAGSLGAVEGLFRALERAATKGLKSHALLMGDGGAVDQASSNRQWEIVVQTVKSMQHPVEDLVSRLGTVALAAQGIDAVAELRFAENRAAEEYRDATRDAVRLKNAEHAERLGYFDQTEGAEYALAKEPSVARDGPPAAGSGGEGDAAEDSPEDADPGAKRAGETTIRLTLAEVAEGGS